MSKLILIAVWEKGGEKKNSGVEGAFLERKKRPQNP